ncbi:MAG: AI-2E family transporter [Gemmatimonadetes bacterium]|nr:AI-2E family transporter [Gemmatimonadota bacterium]
MSDAEARDDGSETTDAAGRVAASPDWRFLYGAIVLAAATLFAISVRSVLSPVLAYGMLLLLLRPYAGTRRHLLILVSASVVLAVWVLETMGGLLAPFILSLAIAYILDPAVDVLERRMPRALAIAVLIVPVVTLIAVALIVVVPLLVQQIATLIDGLPDALRTIQDWLGRLSRMNIPLLPQLEFLDPDRLRETLQDQQTRILEGGLSALLGVGRGVGILLAIFGYVILTPILVVYLLRDFDNITARAASLIPPGRKETWLAFLREYDALLSRFLRGQVLAASIVGLLTWLGLWIIGFPYSGLVGAIAGVFNLVPYLGLVASILPVIVIALLSGSVVASLIKAGIVFAIVQTIDSAVTGPRIVGESVGLHPVWVMLALSIGSFFFGFVGLLLAMPAAVFVKLLIRDGLRRYHASRVYHGTLDTMDLR